LPGSSAIIFIVITTVLIVARLNLARDGYVTLQVMGLSQIDIVKFLRNRLFLCIILWVCTISFFCDDFCATLLYIIGYIITSDTSSYQIIMTQIQIIIAVVVVIVLLLIMGGVIWYFELLGGVAGYIAKAGWDSPGSDILPWNDPSNMGMSLEQCRSRCDAMPNCKGFSYDPAQGDGYCSNKSSIRQTLKAWPGTLYVKAT
jgi:hypothetical protein